ncbi:MAG: flavodoxin family protein [bacterium]
MNILAINGSPRGRRSNTDKILQPFLQGAAQGGAAVDTLYVKDLEIHPCQGCYSCHMKTPGVCVFKDDMPGAIDKMKAAEVLVFATPIYVFSVPSILKAFMDRMIVMGDLKLEVVDGMTVHPPRWPEVKWKWVLIANAGFPEDAVFDPLREMFRHFGRAIGGGAFVTHVASICKGMGELLAVKPLARELEWFFEACRKAGSELATRGGISAETLETLERPLMPLPSKEFAEMSNFYIDKATRLIRERG